MKEELTKNEIKNLIDKTELTQNQLNYLHHSLLQFGINDDKFDDFLNKRDLLYLKNTIFDILVKNGDLKTICTKINSNDTFVDINSLVNGNNIYEVIPFLSKETIYDLGKITISNNTITKGCFEILLQFILNDINEGNKGHCDINFKDGRGIECKMPRGRVAGQKNIQSPVLIDQYFNKFGLNVSGIYSNENNINQVVNKLRYEYKYNNKQLFKVLLEGIYAQFLKTPKVKEVDALYKLTKSSIFIENGFSISSFRKLIGCVQLAEYAKSEKFDYILIFKGNAAVKTKGQKTYEYALKNGDYVIFDNTFAANIENTYNCKNLLLKEGCSCSGPRTYACVIGYL